MTRIPDAPGLIRGYNSVMNKAHPYEEPFLLGLLLLSAGGLLWLFWSFIPALLFALLLAAGSHRLYQRLRTRLEQQRWPGETAAMIMTLAIFLVLVLPLSYLLIEGSQRGVALVQHAQHWLASSPQEELLRMEQTLLERLPLPDSLQTELTNSINSQIPALLEKAKAAALWLASHTLSGAASFTGFFAVTLFSLFFFYRDGERFAQRIKNLSPLSNYLDSFIMQRFAGLSTVLTASVIGTALLQGSAFALLMALLGMPWLSLGLAYAVASFVPVVGGLLIWGPVALWFLATDQLMAASVTALYSAILIGVGIDNLLRPLLLQKLASLQPAGGGNLGALNHTWITMLSTFAGLIQFGIIGLFFGPMLAAMAITVFDVYEHKHRHQLDYS